jgi:hypothetical protein
MHTRMMTVRIHDVCYLENTATRGLFWMVYVVENASGGFETHIRYGPLAIAGIGRRPARSHRTLASALTKAQQLAAVKMSLNYRPAPLPASLLSMIRQVDPNYKPAGPAPRSGSTTAAVIPLPRGVDADTWTTAFASPSYALVRSELVDPSEPMIPLLISFAPRQPPRLLLADGTPAPAVDEQGVIYYLDPVVPALRDATLVGFAGGGGHFEFHDIIRYDGEDLDDMRFADRHALLRQAIAEIDSAGQLSTEWSVAELMSGTDKQSKQPRLLAKFVRTISLRHLAAPSRSPDGWLYLDD